jgi:predicted metal-dependent hydrolase
MRITEFCTRRVGHSFRKRLIHIPDGTTNLIHPRNISEDTSMPALAVRRMNRRWGSYQQRSNQIILNLELIRAATRYIDYVIVHELCHISHRKHSREFYQLLETKLPDWRRLKAELELRLPG